jgi:hypothetical protein
MHPPLAKDVLGIVYLWDNDMSSALFLNVDLDIESAQDLTPLIAAMGSESFSISSELVGTIYRTSLELSSGVDDADAAMVRLIQLVLRLPAVQRKVWDEAAKKSFNIGIKAGTDPHMLEIGLRAETIRSIADVGGSIVITVYRPDGA